MAVHVPTTRAGIFNLILCHGPLWESGETYEPLLRKMNLNACNRDSVFFWSLEAINYLFLPTFIPCISVWRTEFFNAVNCYVCLFVRWKVDVREWWTQSNFLPSVTWRFFANIMLQQRQRCKRYFWSSCRPDCRSKVLSPFGSKVCLSSSEPTHWSCHTDILS